MLGFVQVLLVLAMVSFAVSIGNDLREPPAGLNDERLKLSIP